MTTVTVINAGPLVQVQTGGLRGPAGSGGGEWGSISGTLGDQADLVAALGGKQPLDADLTALAAIATVSYGRDLLTLANAAALTAAINTFVGDAGAGGTKGLVPAPAIGDATKFLRGDGTYAVGGGGGSGDMLVATYDPAGVATQLVGRTSVQTLTSKTLTAPVINSPTGIVKGDVGLGNADNTADTAKPVSTAQQTALNLKANLAGATFTGAIVLAADPTVALNPATKQYVDGLAINVGKRDTVRVATVSNITIATALNNGDVIDGVTLVTGNWVLVKSQTAPEQNGIYDVAASPARIAQYDTFDEHAGALIAVQEGTQADTLWLCMTNVGGTLNTTPITFFKMVTAGELLAANNLSDIASAPTALANIGGQPLDASLTEIAAAAFVQGDVIYHNGTNLVRLPAGSSGHFLKTQGVGLNPIWAIGGSGTGDLLAANNLSDVASIPTARTNLQIPFTTTLREDGKALWWNGSTFVHRHRSPFDSTQDLRDFLDELHGVNGWTLRTTAGTGTDIGPALQDACQYIRSIDNGRGAVFIPPATFRMVTPVPPADLSGIDIKGAGRVASLIVVDMDAGNAFHWNAAGGYTGGGLQNLTIFLEEGHPSSTVVAIRLEGDASFQPSAMYFHNVGITVLGTSFWFEHLRIDGTARVSPQGVRVAEFSDMQMFSARSISVTIRSLVQATFKNVGTYTGSATGDNWLVSGGGAANTNSIQLTFENCITGGQLTVTECSRIFGSIICGTFVTNSTWTKGLLFGDFPGGVTGVPGIGASYVNTLAETMAKPQAAQTWTAVQEFSGAAPVIFSYTDAGAAIGPQSTWMRESASPAASDLLGAFALSGRNSTAASRQYVLMRGKILDPTNASEDGALECFTYVAGAFVQAAGIANGMILGAPTGSYKGTGTLNATEVYNDNVILTCPALQEEFIESGTVDLEKWDALVPDLIIPEEVREEIVEEDIETGEQEPVRQRDGRFKLEPKRVRRPVLTIEPVYDDAGSVVAHVEVPEVRKITIPQRSIERRHEVAHLFQRMVDDGFDPRDPLNYLDRMERDHAMPGMPTEAEWEHSKFGLGEMTNRQWLAMEFLALAFRSLAQKHYALEERVSKIEATQ